MISTTLPRSDIGGLSSIDVGQGRPMVFLHGVGLRAEAWEAQIEVFRDDYRVIAPDMPGHGENPFSSRPVPSRPETIADYADAHSGLLKALNEPALVVGHSMGAMVALQLADIAPQSIGALIALNGIFERSAEATKSVQARAASLDGVTTPDPGPTLVRWFGETSSPERTACEGWLRATAPQGYQLAYTAFARANGPSRTMLQNLSCPALFATGSDEPNSTPQMSRAMAVLASKGQATVIDNAAHMMPMTHAGQVNGMIRKMAREIWP